MSGVDDFWDPDADASDDGGGDAPFHEAGDGPGAVAVKEEEAPYTRDDDDRLAAFYAEASSKQLPLPSPSQEYSQPLSQNSALSLAELSRAEETLLSQTSHHEEEEERQREKLKRKERREKGIRKKFPRTEAQNERERGYQRMRRKTTDLSKEEDVGGSMEYLVKEKLGEQKEQRRLRALARDREKKRLVKEEEAAFLGDDDGENALVAEAEDGANHGAKWNYLEEGYAAMPRAEAEKLPYYVYGNSKRKLSGMQEVADNGTKDKKRKTGHFMLLKQNVERRGRRRGSSKLERCRSELAHSTFEPDNVARSFPLRFHQLKPRMDLHGMVDTTTRGSERMVVSHGRNAKRLWARLVAGGISLTEHDEALNEKYAGNGAKAKNDDDSLSNVSSSSSSSKSSSEQSYQPTGVYSQMSYGATSVIGSQKVDEAVNDVEKPTKSTMLSLMAMVHNLPRVTHRQQLLLKVAQELGTNRRLWEEELQHLVEGDNEEREENEDGGCSVGHRTRNFTPREVWSIKSFLGVDGSVSTPPSWISDPSMPTHPTVLKQRVRGMRSSLLRRLQRRIQIEQRVDDRSRNTKVDDEAMDDTRQIAEVVKKEAPDEEDILCMMKTEEPQVGTELEEEPLSLKEEGISDETMALDPDVVGTEPTNLLNSSLMDNLPTSSSDPSSVDKYAKITHESDIDTANISVALASFLNELTSSLARLRELQDNGSNDFQHRHALNVAQEEVRHWHDSILSYLAMAEALSRPRDANFYKTKGEFPENAPLAQAIMATQSYLANGGGVGHVSKKKAFHPSQWEVKNEDHSSDESDGSGPDDNDPGISPKDLSKVLEKKELRGIKLAAKEIVRKGKDCLANAHLTSFTPISVTTGIAMIAESLTPAAAELVSRQCCPDAPDNRTPFDLLSNVVLLIEEDGSLISPSHSSSGLKGKVIDEMLVQSMREAAMMFRTCIEKDPDDVDHWSWYVATLLGMLCIAVGSSAPKTKVEHGHVERPQLDSFHEIRSSASAALADFVKFTQSHACPIFHFAVSSMLEWQRAIILLHRSSSKDSLGLQARQLHAYHIYHWAKADCSSTSIARIHQLYESELLPRDALRDILAGAVERNPFDRKNWVRLVKALGNVKPTSNDDGSNECSHTSINVQSKEDFVWWGQHRMSEWTNEFFRAPKSASKAVKPEFVGKVSDAVDSAFRAKDSRSQNPKKKTTDPVEEEVTSIPDPGECMGWIWGLDDNDASVEYDFDSSMHDALPVKLTDATTNESLLDSDDHVELPPSCEAICMKIVVACHLLGVWHPFVCDSVWWLAAKLWQSKQSSHFKGYYNADGLDWLALRGLDVMAYLRCRTKDSSEYRIYTTMNEYTPHS